MSFSRLDLTSGCRLGNHCPKGLPWERDPACGAYTAVCSRPLTAGLQRFPELDPSPSPRSLWAGMLYLPLLLPPRPISTKDSVFRCRAGSCGEDVAGTLCAKLPGPCPQALAQTVPLLGMYTAGSHLPGGWPLLLQSSHLHSRQSKKQSFPGILPSLLTSCRAECAPTVTLEPPLRQGVDPERISDKCARTAVPVLCQ